MAQLVVNIPDKELVSFIEMTKKCNFEVVFEQGGQYPIEFIEMLEERDRTPREKWKSSRDFLQELVDKYHV